VNRLGHGRGAFGGSAKSTMPPQCVQNFVPLGRV
jgi:hypothetical protein